MCGPHQVWPLRSVCCGRGVPTKVVCAECMKMCCLGGKNSVVKGLNAPSPPLAAHALLSILSCYFNISPLTPGCEILCQGGHSMFKNLHRQPQGWCNVLCVTIRKHCPYFSVSLSCVKKMCDNFHMTTFSLYNVPL